MKYLKTYEGIGFIKSYLYPIMKEEINGIYEYLYNINANPKVYKITPDLAKPKLLGYDLYNLVKDKDYLLYFKPNDIVPLYLINRSLKFGYIAPNLKIDEEKENEIKLYLTRKKYNL